jgi:hypothetical protein
MNEMEMMQLSRLLNAMVGEPPHRVTVGAVRRKVLMRRLITGVTATAVAAFAVSAGLVISAHALGKHPATNARPRTTEPRYYFEATRSRSGHLRDVVRSTATGAVTARLHCPGPDPNLRAVAAASHETFFMACHGMSGTRIYRFALTLSGRVTGFGLLTGGKLSGLHGDSLAASPNGAEVAIAITPARSAPPTDILVINTRTGKHAIWHAAHAPGGLGFEAQDLSFARNGRVLAVFGWAFCLATAPPTCKDPHQEMVAVNHAAAGGRLANGRVLLTLHSLTADGASWINDAFIRPDGATAIAVVVFSRTAIGRSAVLRVSAATGKPSGVLFRGPGDVQITPDPSGRFVLAVESPLLRRDDRFGWIDHGKLALLGPAARFVWVEAW